jgi:hypothetical protein
VSFCAQVIYFGDSLRSDVFPGKSYAGWESVLILEEMVAEQWQGNQLLHKADTAGTSTDDWAAGEEQEEEGEEGGTKNKKQKKWVRMKAWSCEPLEGFCCALPLFCWG